MKLRTRLGAMGCGLVLLACGGGGAGPTDGGAGEGWRPLVTLAWTVPSGTDAYRCTRVALTEDVWLRGLRAQAPPGTHHVTLAVAEPGAAPGDYACQTGNLEPRLLYSAGSSAPVVALPEGVALPLRAGQVVSLNLHLVNATNDPLSGTSGVQIEALAAAAGRAEAEMVFAGPTRFTVPANSASYTARASCAVGTAGQVFSLWPYMHRRGHYQKATLNHAGSTTALFDGLYSFDEQRTSAVPLQALAPGDTIEVECTYSNLTAIPAPFGPGANDEQCYLGLYRYPVGAALSCVE